MVPINKQLAVFLLIIIFGLAHVSSGSMSAFKLISSSGVISYPPTDIAFEDDFESKDFGAWSGLTITSGGDAAVLTTSPYQGIYSAKFQTEAAASEKKRACAYENIEQGPVIYARGYFYIAEGLPLIDTSDRFTLIQFLGLGGFISGLQVRRVQGEDRFAVCGFTGDVLTTSDVYPQDNTWYCLELFTRIHETEGAIRAYVDGVEMLAITGIDTTTLGNIATIRFGLANSINVQHKVVVYCDLVVISTSYIGPEESETHGTWAVIGPIGQIPQIRNLFWLFGNQSISYAHVDSQDVTSYEIIKGYSGLVAWTSLGNVYNFSAVKLFAKTRPVILHIFDFSYYLYPALKESMRTVHTSTVTYVTDWGNFRKSDNAEMHNGTKYLTTVEASDLAGFANVTTIAEFDTSRIALFHMRSSRLDAGFYVMDLYATRPNSYEAGNWHLFPVISKTASIKVGCYSRWLADSWHEWVISRSLEWVYDWEANFSAANDDIVTMQSIGETVQGRPINALFIGGGTRNFIADAAIHGNEKGATCAIIRFAELIVEWYRSSSSWQQKLAQYKVILIPVLNPDGYAADTRENANGKDLNRQFPPEGTTTEPEAWALRWLMGNYTPTHYVNLHIGGSDYPLDVFYAGSSVDPYRTYTKLALNEGNLRFQDLNHWGKAYDTVWVGKYNRISPSGVPGMAADYAYYKHKAASVTVEHWSNRIANLHNQEFFITVMLGLLLHHDRTDGFMLHSNTFITETTCTGTSDLLIHIDTEYIVSDQTSETRIYNFMSLGKPEYVYIDGTQKAEGDGWSWNDSSQTATVVGATESIFVDWAS